MCWKVVLMEEGLCFHGYMGLNISCGGIVAERGPALNFFRNVFQMLNLKNSDAKAVMTAGEGKINRQQLLILSQAAHDLEVETNGLAKAEIIWGANHRFLGIEITKTR